MQVLIIGGTRRCGPYIVRDLVERGHTVICYHRGQHNVSFTDEVLYIHGDRRDHETFKQQVAKLEVDAVIDMIAIDDRDVRAVVEVFKGRIGRYICISSYEVYEAFEAAWKHVPSAQPVPIPEEAPKRGELFLYGPDFHYDKLLVEKEALEAHERGDFAVTILRWPALYGPRDVTPREWYYVRQALDGRRQIPVPEGGQALFPRGYLRNMAHTVVLALEREEAAGGIYNAADTRALSLRQIVELIGKIMDHEWEIVPVPRRLLPHVPQTQGRPFSCDPYDIEPHLLLDLTRIRTELGYHDLVPPEEALEETVKWLCERPPRDDWLHVDYGALDEAIRVTTGGE
jgi:nucleoside-diphosphate-sugar epimerase